MRKKRKRKKKKAERLTLLESKLAIKLQCSIWTQVERDECTGP